MMQELFVDDQQALQALCERLRGCTLLALDTEFMREKTYHPRLCLLQLATDELIACVDPLAIADPAPLLEIICDPATVKVLHAARQDLELLLALCGRMPVPVFDTQIAAALLGQGHQIGYAALARELLGVDLDKSHTRTDWARRPLVPEQLRYAADDVRHLLPLHRLQGEALAARGRLRWLEEECAVLTDARRYRTDEREVWRRLRGAQYLQGRQLAVLRELAAWREARAMARDKPRKWILPDDVLLEIARQAPSAMDRLARIRGLPESVLHREGEQILRLVREAQESPPERWPVLEPRLLLTEEQEAQADTLMAAARHCAAANAINVELLVTRRELEALVTGGREAPVLQGWRRGLLGELLLDLLEGRRRLRIEDGELKFEDGR